MHGQTESRLFKIQFKKTGAEHVRVGIIIQREKKSQDDIFLALQIYRGANNIDEVHARRRTTAAPLKKSDALAHRRSFDGGTKLEVLFLYFFHYEQMFFFVVVFT